MRWLAHNPELTNTMNTFFSQEVVLKMIINFPGTFESRWVSILKRVLQAISKDGFCTNTANIGVNAKLDNFPEKFSSKNSDSF